MNFTLREKSKEEIAKEFESAVKHRQPQPCPMQVILKTGKTIEVWDLEEDKILSLVDSNMLQLTDKEPRQPDKIKDSFRIIKCWHEKHKDVSVDFIEGYYGLKDKYNNAHAIEDFLKPIVSGKIDQAKIIADYLNGMQGDKKEITSQNIIKILRNQEMIAQNRKEFKDSKKI